MKKNEPIRVLHVVTIMNRAGLETMLMNYYRHIDRSRVQFDFLVHRSDKGAYEDEIINLGGRIYRFDPISVRSMLRYRSKIAKFLMAHPEYRIVHSHLDALSALPLSGALDAHVPVRIAHSHNNNFDKTPDIVIREVLKRLITRYATDLMACSTDAGRFMFGSKSNFEVLYNAIDIEKFTFNSAMRNRKRKELGLEGKFVVGHVGRFAPQKNHEFLIEVFEDVHSKRPEAHLVLVGEGGLELEIRELVNRKGLTTNVTFLPPSADIPDIMQVFDVFALPSIYEGLGIVAVEAQAAGLPVVLSDGVSREVELTKYCTFLDLDTKSWGDHLLNLSHARISSAGLSKNSDQYSIGKAAALLAKKYTMRFEG